LQIPQTNGLSHGIVLVDPLLGGSPEHFTVTSTIHVPSGATLDCQGAILYFPQTSGVMVQIGSAHPTTSATVQTTVKNCFFAGPEYTPISGNSYIPSDTSNGLTIGGDPGANWRNVVNGIADVPGTAVGSTAGGNGVRVENVVIAGFHAGIQGGNNFFSNTFTSVFGYLNYNVVEDTVCGTNAEEENTWNGGQLWGNWGNTMVMECGNQWNLQGVSLDYGNAAGLNLEYGTSTVNARAASAEIYGTKVQVAGINVWLEHKSGPLVYTHESSSSNNTILFVGGHLVPSAPYNVTAPIASCASDGTVLTLTSSSTFPTSLTTINGGPTGLVLSFSGFSGNCASLNGLTLSICGSNSAVPACTGITSTTMTFLNAPNVNGVSTGTVSVPVETGYISLNNSGGAGQEQVTILGPVSVNGIASGGPENKVNAWVDTAGDGSAITCLFGVQGDAGFGPAIGGLGCTGGTGGSSLTINPLTLNGQFGGGIAGRPPLSINASSSGTVNGIWQDFYASNAGVVDANPMLRIRDNGGIPEFLFGPGGSTPPTHYFHLGTTGISLVTDLWLTGPYTGAFGQTWAQIAPGGVNPCPGHPGMMATATDATVSAAGSIVNAGGGGNTVLAWCNGTNFIVK